MSGKGSKPTTRNDGYVPMKDGYQPLQKGYTPQSVAPVHNVQGGYRPTTNQAPSSASTLR